MFNFSEMLQFIVSSFKNVSKLRVFSINNIDDDSMPIVINVFIGLTLVSIMADNSVYTINNDSIISVPYLTR